MEWNELTKEEQLVQLQEESRSKPVLIFKFSSRCSVSRVALDRLERKWNDADMGHVKPYFLDLIANRSTSDKIASEFLVPHASPQVLIIENGRSIYDESHFGIDYGRILEITQR
jgi:bacillithiol system protein YtxJ